MEQQQKPAFQQFQLLERPQDQLIFLQLKTQQCNNPAHYQFIDQYLSKCFNFHNIKDRRRCLFNMDGTLKYNQILCPNIMQNQECNENCQYSHNNFEALFHLYMYCTEQCQNVLHITEKIQNLNNLAYQPSLEVLLCPHFHQIQQKRINIISYLQSSPMSQFTAPQQQPTFQQLGKEFIPSKQISYNNQQTPYQYPNQNQYVNYNQQQQDMSQLTQLQNLNEVTLDNYDIKQQDQDKYFKYRQSNIQTMQQNEFYEFPQEFDSQSSMMKYQQQKQKASKKKKKAKKEQKSTLKQIFEVYEFEQLSGPVTIKYLNLDKFKQEQCHFSHQHNHKHCRFYHSDKDRRRPNGVYTSDLCNKEEQQCYDSDKCQLAHNRVERLYHVEKYKTKYCTFYPNKLNKCEYEEYCSFAHSESELKTRLIHLYEKDQDFYMFHFKTEWCPYVHDHNKSLCDYAHNWSDFRRNPSLFSYNNCNMCEYYKGGNYISRCDEGCSHQSSCHYCHGWKEYEYHPFNYKTMPCDDKKCQFNLLCPYYHSQKERRSIKLIDPNFIKTPKQRESNKGFKKIATQNLTINNVNHLKELLINLEIDHLGLNQLRVAFKTKKISNIFLKYMEERLVVWQETLTKETNITTYQSNLNENFQSNDFQMDQASQQQYKAKLQQFEYSQGKNMKQKTKLTEFQTDNKTVSSFDSKASQNDYYQRSKDQNDSSSYNQRQESQSDENESNLDDDFEMNSLFNKLNLQLDDEKDIKKIQIKEKDSQNKIQNCENQQQVFNSQKGVQESDLTYTCQNMNLKFD